MTSVRFTRDGSGWRVFTGGDLIGGISTARVVVNERTGRKANRWHYWIAASAWGLSVTPPPHVPVRATIGPLPAAVGNRVDAARKLVEHLRSLRCPTVGALYGGRHA